LKKKQNPSQKAKIAKNIYFDIDFRFNGFTYKRFLIRMVSAQVLAACNISKFLLFAEQKLYTPCSLAYHFIGFYNAKGHSGRICGKAITNKP